MIEWNCKVVASWNVSWRVEKGHRFWNKAFNSDLINSCMEWFVPNLVFINVFCGNYCIVFGGVLPAQIQISIPYFMWQNVPDTLEIFFSFWGKYIWHFFLHFQGLKWNLWAGSSEFISRDRYITLDKIESVQWYHIIVMKLSFANSKYLRKFNTLKDPSKRAVFLPYVILFNKFLKLNSYFSKPQIRVCLCIWIVVYTCKQKIHFVN